MVIVWKYRHKKQKLWDSLERKYGTAVREVNEWEGYEKEKAGGEDETDEQNLDEETAEQEEASTADGEEL